MSDKEYVSKCPAMYYSTPSKTDKERVREILQHGLGLQNLLRGLIEITKEDYNKYEDEWAKVATQYFEIIYEAYMSRYDYVNGCDVEQSE